MNSTHDVIVQLRDRPDNAQRWDTGSCVTTSIGSLCRDLGRARAN